MWGFPGTDLRRLQDYGYINPASVGNYSELDLLRYPYLSNASPQSITPGGSNWLNYLGLGAMAAAPVAGALLGRQPPRPDFVPGTSVGSKPIYEAQSVYRPQQPRMPAFLARLLMGR